MADSYLTFVEEASASGKTRVVRVLSARHGDVLGAIRWFGRWRQYAFWPATGTVFNPDCLVEINGRIASLMADRRG